ncbi:hypothetical protein [Sinomicrobium weinanense]|uniref:Uncharacterized protein n=1 Tax=Sinomicrobium weinanense TaxID=2842200 RepID=A0A926Q271_9FLAO|nr:hypothetical protein [Sinomicrobium weinanense]MBC9794606.1 hypothetical protein [Sinomicrobium weinanense]MBU3124091.1 hypothetical protein [Sinomicrobium weinanense]
MKLKTILLVNAISSGITGLILSVVPTVFATIFQVSETLPFTEVGIFLILFSAFTGFTALGNPIRINRVKTIIGLDITWVVASFICVAILFSKISGWGSFMMIGVAAWVGLMAFLQATAVKRSGT